MSAECRKCGRDLDWSLNCAACDAEAKLERAEAERDAAQHALREIGRIQADKWAFDDWTPDEALARITAVCRAALAEPVTGTPSLPLDTATNDFNERQMDLSYVSHLVLAGDWEKIAEWLSRRAPERAREAVERLAGTPSREADERVIEAARYLLSLGNPSGSAALRTGRSELQRALDAYDAAPRDPGALDPKGDGLGSTP